MASRILVCVSPAAVSMALWKGRITACMRFENDESGQAEFAQALESLPRVPVLFMVDAVDEDYRIETMPHVSGRDRREMLERKLRQTYRAAPFVAARVLARSRGQGRRADDSVLFAAVTDTELLSPWIGTVVDLDIPIAGVFAVPTVTPAVAKPLGLSSPAMLIVSRHAAGLRQTFLRDGEFRFSRLTLLRGLAETGTDAAIGAEIVNTRMYLNALQAATADEVVDVVILDQDDSLEGLREAVAVVQGMIRARRIGRTELAKRLKIPAGSLDTTLDALHLHLLGTATPAENLAPAPLGESFRLWRTSRWLLGASTAVAGIAAIWFALNLHTVSGLDEERLGLVRETDRLQTRYAELTREFPETPVTAVRLKQTVDVFEGIRQRARTPEGLFQVVSRSLETRPTVNLVSVAWRHGHVADAAAAFTAAPPQGTAQATAAPLIEVGLITGEIAPFNGDYRTAVATIRAFAEDLRNDPRVADARILKLPLDDSSRQNLSGTTAIRSEQQVGAKFEIAITLRASGGPG